jgi:hypothetical protein
MRASCRPLRGLAAPRVVAMLLALCAFLGSARAQDTPPRPVLPTGSTTARPVAEQGPSWGSLTATQRQALAPLQRDWQTLDAPRKSKWLEIAERYPKMTAQDQERLQARMNEWARMTPQERTLTRQQYQGAKQVPRQERQASWEAYQALPENERLELANRARPAAASAPGPAVVASGPAKTKAKATPDAASLAQQRLGPSALEGPQPKVNAVPAPGATPAPKPVAPSVVQAQPGATTTLISKPPAPPAHQPSGMPKIAATPDYVDKKTLLPQTGPQSTAPRRAPAPASAPTARP